MGLPSFRRGRGLFHQAAGYVTRSPGGVGGGGGEAFAYAD